ncbi:malate/lactate/ureidoglycolate dehydrogenase [Serratia fonticola]|uniref:Malate/lactate/ureidoglycolate dehydrogenase n=1 Tax=Serratia fonticola TaxID=47917 RepID=A0AAJ1YH87_SERFO|nr:malate/lactate/ureidoglycolate dehydrogenase [Serratia fonticola]MDQ9130213.1 malate/lactate/ureidoglycolate dehydrogenase [Serratia fonticola]
MPIFSHHFLRQYLHDRLTDISVAPEVATSVADNLVESCLKGHDSHGVSMLPRYIAAIREGELDPAAKVKVTADFGAFLSFDGLHGFGQVVGQQAIALGIERARQQGVAVLSLANAHHLGRIGAWAEQAAEAGLVSLHFANVVNNRANVVPWQGQAARLGTNPFCAGIPVQWGEPIILDFATSMMAGNKVRIAWNEGRQLEPGRIIDNLGNPTVEPRYLMEEPFGALLAFGEHKGSGLALVCSLLGAALTGGSTERSIEPGKQRIVNNMLSILIDPQRLGGADSHQQEIPALLEWVKSSRQDSSLKLPGEWEQWHYNKRLAEGISIDDVSWRQLSELESPSNSMNN